MGLKFKSILHSYLHNSDNGTNYENTENKEKLTEEDDKNTILDSNTNLKLRPIDIGNKTYNTSCKYLDIPQLENFSNNDKILLVHYQRKSNDKLMKIDEVKQYIDCKNGNIFFKKSVTPEILYKIAKSLNSDFYLAINNKDNVIPISKWCANQIFKNKNDITVNKKMHIENFESSNNDKFSSDEQFQIALHNWFGKNVRHKHPYAYSDMVINKQVKNYTFTQKGSNGAEIRTHTQFSNELTNKYLTADTFHELKYFVNKISRALNDAQQEHKNEKGEKYYKKYLFAMPFPLYDREHMLSIVVAVLPTGKVNITIINANHRSNAEEDYARPIMNILNRAFKTYAPNTLAKNTKYFFQEHKSQYGPTCMTHADVITRQIVKDENLEKDCQNINPIKILEKAYLRGFATTLYQHALKQGRFIPDRADTLEKLKQETRHLIPRKSLQRNKRYYLRNRRRNLRNRRPNTSFKTYFSARQGRNNRRNLIFSRKQRRLNNKRFIDKQHSAYRSIFR